MRKLTRRLLTNEFFPSYFPSLLVLYRLFGACLFLLPGRMQGVNLTTCDQILERVKEQTSVAFL